jgi:hypothetical protein
VLSQFGVEGRLNSQLGEHFCKIIQVMLSFKSFGQLIGQLIGQLLSFRFIHRESFHFVATAGRLIHNVNLHKIIYRLIIYTDLFTPSFNGSDLAMMSFRNVVGNDHLLISYLVALNKVQLFDVGHHRKNLVG